MAIIIKGGDAGGTFGTVTYPFCTVRNSIKYPVPYLVNVSDTFSVLKFDLVVHDMHAKEKQMTVSCEVRDQALIQRVKKFILPGVPCCVSGIEGTVQKGKEIVKSLLVTDFARSDLTEKVNRGNG